MIIKTTGRGLTRNLSTRSSSICQCVNFDANLYVRRNMINVEFKLRRPMSCKSIQNCMHARAICGRRSHCSETN